MLDMLSRPFFFCQAEQERIPEKFNLVWFLSLKSEELRHGLVLKNSVNSATKFCKGVMDFLSHTCQECHITQCLFSAVPKYFFTPNLVL